MTVTLDEQKVVRGVLGFANLEISSTTQVETLFKNLPLTPKSKGDFRVIGADKVAFYRTVDQSRLRRWLATIVTSREKAPDKIGREVDEKLRNTARAVFAFDEDKSRLHTDYDLDGVEALCGFGTALLLDRERGLTHRLRRCGWSQCRRFLIEFHGQPKMYCSDAHFRHAEVERVTRSRQRHAARKRRVRVRRRSKWSSRS